MVKDAYRSTSPDAIRSKCLYISTDSTGVSTVSIGVHGSTCPYISTKGMGVHRGTSTDVSMETTVVQGGINAYDKRRR